MGRALPVSKLLTGAEKGARLLTDSLDLGRQQVPLGNSLLLLVVGVGFPESWRQVSLCCELQPAALFTCPGTRILSCDAQISWSVCRGVGPLSE